MKLFTRNIEGDKSQPLLVMLHGLYSSSSNWYTLARDLGCRVKLIDLPNHGRSDWSSEFSYRSLADAVRVEITEPCVLFGHSLGGRVAIMLAAENPRLIDRLIVEDISPVSDTKTDKAITLYHGMFLQHLLEAKQTGVTDIESYLKANGAPAEMTAAVEQAYRQMNIKVVADNIMNLPKEWTRIASHLNKIEQRTLIIRGGKSPYVPESALPLLQDTFPKLTIETIPDGTHRLHHEYPEDFVKTIINFISSQQ